MNRKEPLLFSPFITDHFPEHSNTTRQIPNTLSAASHSRCSRFCNSSHVPRLTGSYDTFNSTTASCLTCPRCYTPCSNHSNWCSACGELLIGAKLPTTGDREHRETESTFDLVDGRQIFNKWYQNDVAPQRPVGELATSCPPLQQSNINITTNLHYKYPSVSSVPADPSFATLPMVNVPSFHTPYDESHFHNSEENPSVRQNHHAYHVAETRLPAGSDGIEHLSYGFDALHLQSRPSVSLDTMQYMSPVVENYVPSCLNPFNKEPPRTASYPDATGLFGSGYVEGEILSNSFNNVQNIHRFERQRCISGPVRSATIFGCWNEFPESYHFEFHPATHHLSNHIPPFLSQPSFMWQDSDIPFTLQHQQPNTFMNHQVDSNHQCKQNEQGNRQTKCSRNKNSNEYERSGQHKRQNKHVQGAASKYGKQKTAQNEHLQRDVDVKIDVTVHCNRSTISASTGKPIPSRDYHKPRTIQADVSNNKKMYCCPKIDLAFNTVSANTGDFVPNSTRMAKTSEKSQSSRSAWSTQATSCMKKKRSNSSCHMKHTANYSQERCNNPSRRPILRQDDQRTYLRVWSSQPGCLTSTVIADTPTKTDDDLNVSIVTENVENQIDAQQIIACKPLGTHSIVETLPIKQPDWLSLPDELWLLIIHPLPRPDRARLALTCRRFSNLVRDPSLWRVIELRRHQPLTDIALDSIGRLKPHKLSLTYCHGDALKEDSLNRLFKSCGPHLRKLSLIGCTKGLFEDDRPLLLAAKHCPNLSHVNASYTQAVRDQTVIAVAKSALHLVSVKLNGAQRISNSAIQQLVHYHKHSLQRLELFGCFRLNSDIFNVLGRCQQLRALAFGHLHHLSSDGLLELVGKLPLLSSLDLRGTQTLANNANLTRLAERCPNLEEVILANMYSVKHETDVTEMVCRLPRLRVLDLCGLTVIGDLTLQAIANACPLLEELDVSCTSITQKGLQYLTQRAPKNLHCLRVSNCLQIRLEALKQLVLVCDKLKLIYVCGLRSIEDWGALQSLRPSLVVVSDYSS